MDSIYCLKCGEQNSAQRTTCRSCFVILKQHSGASPEVCGQCRAISPTGAVYCTACGVPIQGGSIPSRSLVPPIRPGPGPRPGGKPKAEGQEEGEFALSSRIVLAFGGFWTALAWILWATQYLAPIMIFKCELQVSTAFFFGLWGALHLLEQVWVLLDIIDRGSPKWWLAVTFIIPPGLCLYMIMERSDG